MTLSQVTNYDNQGDYTIELWSLYNNNQNSKHNVGIYLEGIMALNIMNNNNNNNTDAIVICNLFNGFFNIDYNISANIWNYLKCGFIQNKRLISLGNKVANFPVKETNFILGNKLDLTFSNSIETIEGSITANYIILKEFKLWNLYIPDFIDTKNT